MNLKNLTIVITRPKHQAQDLAEKITSLGGKTILFPTIDIADISDTTSLQNLIAQLKDFNLAIFISPNAVQKAAHFIKAQYNIWPHSVKIAAIGSSTAKALHDLGWRVDIYPVDKFNSETLLGLPALQHIAKQKIILFCGEGGRELIAETLQQRGAIVEVATVYRRVLPKSKPFLLNNVDIIICTSNTSLQNLLTLADEKDRKLLKSKQLLVISSRLIELARNLGFTQPPILADNATDEAIIKALKTWRRNAMESTTQTEKSNQLPPAKKFISGIALLGLVLSLLTASILAFYYYEAQTSFTLLNKQFNATQQQLKNHEITIQQLRETTNTLTKELKQQQITLSKLPTVAEHTTWVAAEANYLAQLASYHLYFNHDVFTAIALLQAADQRVSALKNTTAIHARQVLATTITTLQALPKIDLAGLLARLNALQTQATQLPLLVPTVNKPAMEMPDKSSNWRDALGKSWEHFQQLIVIRHSEMPIKPLLSAQQQAYLQQNLQLLLQQAQWSVLNKQSKVYHSSLAQAAEWINQYFALNAPATTAMLQAINELQKINLEPTLPNINNLLNALEKIPSDIKATDVPNTNSFSAEKAQL